MVIDANVLPPERLHDEMTADDTGMTYAAPDKQVEDRRKAFIRNWLLRHRDVGASPEKASDRRFAFVRPPN